MVQWSTKPCEILDSLVVGIQCKYFNVLAIRNIALDIKFLNKDHAFDFSLVYYRLKNERPLNCFIKFKFCRKI